MLSNFYTIDDEVKLGDNRPIPVRKTYQTPALEERGECAIIVNPFYLDV